MRIICDMDEVLAELNNKVLKRWNAVSGKNFTKQDITTWRMEHVLGVDNLGRSAEGLIDEWLAEPGFYEDLEPIPGAIEGFQELLDIGHDVVIATSIPEKYVNAFDSKRRWVRRHFPGYSMKNFVSISRKGSLEGDILIDDGGHNIIDWAKNGRKNAFLMVNPWNEYLGQTVHGMPITRVWDWGDIRREVEDLAKKKYDDTVNWSPRKFA